jgi:hypothetical protein
MITRLIIFGRSTHEGRPCRCVVDILEVACRPRLGELKRRLTRFNEHNPELHLRSRETFRQLRAGELDFTLELVAR